MTNGKDVVSQKSFVNNLHLLAYTLFVDGLEHLLYEFRTHTAECALSPTLVEDFVVTSCLEDGHAMFLLERTDFTTHAHTLRQYLDDAIVAFVNLCAEFAQAFGGMLFLTDDEEVEDVAQDVRCNLL